MESSYTVFKMLHIFGVILFIGNFLTTLVLKVIADASKEQKIIAFCQRSTGITDHAFTGLGSIIIVITGLMMGVKILFDESWILLGLIFFSLSALIRVFVIIPIQVKQKRIINGFQDGVGIPEEYWRLASKWRVAAILAIILPILNIYLMVCKPIW